MQKLWPKGFNAFSTSTNFDYWIKKNVLFRVEAKYYDSEDKIFNNQNDNFVISTSLSIKI